MPPSITVGIPQGDYFTVCRDFSICLSRMIAYSYNEKVINHMNLVYAVSPKTADNRNAIFESRKGEGVLQIDADMTFAPDTLKKFLETSAKFPDCIIAGLGMMGSPPYFPALYKWDEKEAKGIPLGDWANEPFEVDLCGSFGFYVPESVIAKIDHWFDHMILTSPDGKTSKEVRHDFAFCLRAKAKGIKVICDPSIKFGHIRPYPITEADWIANREVMIAEAKKKESAIVTAL